MKFLKKLMINFFFTFIGAVALMLAIALLFIPAAIVSDAYGPEFGLLTCFTTASFLVAAVFTAIDFP